MPLNKYAHEQGVLAREASGALSEEQIQSLLGKLQRISPSEWAAWKDEHAQQLIDFLKSSPSQRKRIFRNHPDIELLTFAGYQHYAQARDFLFALSHCNLGVGGSYRNMAVTAYLTHQQILDLPEPDWPYPWYPEPWS